MKTFTDFRNDQKLITERFLTYAECRKAYYEGVKDGSIGKCPGCGSPNLSGLIAPDFESKKCVDCGKTSDQWRIKLKEEELDEDGEAPTNSMSSGQIPGANIPAGSSFGEPGVPPRKLKLVNGPPYDPRMFSSKIFSRKPNNQ
jgi:hypothetical protein